MISLNELKKITKISGLNIYQQEKDYLLKLFLYFYYKAFEDAIFKGGTCIKYLYGLPRFSEDIDFNITILPETFQKQIHSNIKKIELIGIKTYFIKEETFKHAYTCEIGFHGPLYQGTEQTRNKIRIDAGKRIGTILPAEWKLIQSEYPEIKTNFLVKAMHEEEMLVEKIISLINRKKGRDLYDVWFLLEKKVPINNELFYQKTSKKFSMKTIPNEQEYNRDIEKLANRVISYNQIIKTIEKKLKNKL
jgi:uncharacterized protein